VADGFPVKIAVSSDMEAVCFCKAQIGGALFGGMLGVKALNPIQPCVMDGRDAFRGPGLPPLNALVFVLVQIAVEGLPEG